MSGGSSGRVVAPMLLSALLSIGTAVTFGRVPSTGPDPSVTTAAVAGNGTLYARTELYFGQSRPGGEVSEAEFAGFLDEEITPRFPDGLTLLSGLGQYASSSGLVEERSKVVILLYPLTDQDADREIEEIRASYRTLFDQESVLRIDTTERAQF